jgi:acyl-ACP thioesterase
MSSAPAEIAPPGPGRVFAVPRTVRLGEVLPTGEARLDALARYLEDAAVDDAVDAAIDQEMTWVVRRTVLSIARRPRLGEQLGIATWASGAGSRWAERRTTVRARRSPGVVPLIEATALWVCVDAASRRPCKLSPRFWQVYGEAVAGRAVSSRLTHSEPPPGLLDAGRPWPLRVADIDVLEHLNNAATWSAVDDELHRRAPGRAVGFAELEYRGATGPDVDLRLCSEFDGGQARMWLVAGGEVQASAVTRFAAGLTGEQRAAP